MPHSVYCTDSSSSIAISFSNVCRINGIVSIDTYIRSPKDLIKLECDVFWKEENGSFIII